MELEFFLKKPSRKSLRRQDFEGVLKKTIVLKEKVLEKIGIILNLLKGHLRLKIQNQRIKNRP